MPIEIKELVIKATTTMQSDQSQSALGPQEAPQNQEEIIEECVRRVLKILERKKER